MPLEIKELHIKINVNDSNQSNASPNKEAGNNTGSIVEECVEQIMNIQDRKQER